MTVHFIGAGPGAADLITLRGLRIIQNSPVCLYAGTLIPKELLEHCPDGARLIDTSTLDLEGIINECQKAHTEGHDVARLASGDLSVYSAVAEQIRRLQAVGIDYTMTPGVPAFAAAAATLGHELTVPEVGQTVILTRISRSATAMPPGENLATLGASRALLVLHLATAHIDDVVAELLPNYGPDCPAAVVALASRPDEIVLRGQLDNIAAATKEAGIRRTAVILVGQTLGAKEFPDSHLYSMACAAERRTEGVPAPIAGLPR
ncbi:precorrin-4 C(11)-methyltransferase [Dermatophilus congolensis]|uniref:precorrin-4 C(11)-methyltransferase n=1 Tax=Dermatophilus congolensis TaxID=1863 RepID=UPI001AAF7099|nr:precorrin-4 C(11)-methyltransferase [Dermatophilus congolensis]MBO3143054.1 precorrin-4 C(11)-methyltransferase [Dermatophilus congolensis]MBO3152042.1 precorrin-4 C(11)-methyltransferase [Dermatophilus congolensis]MBO3160946.1 precorrin-4 C(11)-methyltransferase [Dermatophilus congolensis]MBO3163329.1 precorrin-4 C(11)-methyltransferase [Dermatophilus congolensis]MBO3176884.1 precorrin-4 C(11)-methyltransferase [Dermatophilus congolensis]